MKILFVHDYPDVGAGAEASLLLILKNIGRFKVDPVCALPADGTLAQALDRLNIPVENLPLRTPSVRSGTRKTVLSLINMAWSQLAMTRVLIRHRPSLVHANSVLAALTSMLPCWFTRTPLVCHVRLFVQPTKASKIAFLLLTWLGTHFIVISQSVRDHLVDNFELSPSTLSLLPNAVDLTQFQNEHVDADEDFGFPENRRIVGIVGQIATHKGQDDFILAASRIHQHMPDVRFVVVGATVNWDGPYRLDSESLDTMISSLNMDGIVKLVGIRGDIPRVMRSLDVLVVASRFEPFGRVVIEGMAAGTPVVAYGVGGIREIIQHGVDGVLVEPGNVEVLSEEICRLLQDPEKSFRITQCAKRTVQERYDVQSQLRNLIRIYGDLRRQ